MSLHLATLSGYEPDAEMAAYGTAVHAALVEAGYPDAHVSVNKYGPAVNRIHHDYETGVTHFGPPDAVIERAFAICGPLLGGDES